MAALEHAIDLVEHGSSCVVVDEATLLSIHGLHMDLPISCDFCSQEFYDLNVFDTHMLTHLECRYFSCQLCNNTYQSWGNLVAHRKACHHGRVLSCEDCGKRKLHLNLGPVNYPVGNLLHGCEECNEGFSSMPHLIRHYSKKHNEHNTSHTEKLNVENVEHVPTSSILMNLVCPLCKTRFINLEQLSAHITELSTVHQQLNLSCNICQTQFCNNLLLKEHMSSHANYCRKKFYKSTSNTIPETPPVVYNSDNEQVPIIGVDNDCLKKQILVSCPVCMQVFSGSTALKCHMKLHRPMPHANEEILTCMICNIEIKNERGLINHLQSKHCENLTTEYQNIIQALKCNRVVQKKIKFTCEYCGQEFNKKENLILHVRRHLGERPYTCQCCEKSFYTNQQLSIHNYQHSGKRPYICKITKCKKTFTSPTALYMHHRLHNNLKSYTCPHCDRKFSYQSSYIGHVRLHTGHRPFSCSLCNKTFTVKGKLNLHLKKHNKQQCSFQHRCSDCGICFSKAEELSSHCNEECCVTLVTVAEGNDSSIIGKKSRDSNQYIIRFLDQSQTF